MSYTKFCLFYSEITEWYSTKKLFLKVTNTTQEEDKRKNVLYNCTI